MKKVNKDTWEQANKSEINTWNAVLDDENKIYETDIFFSRHALVMGLPTYDDGRIHRVVDIGGGPLSGMLKYKGIAGTVIDPILFDDKWIKRYSDKGIEYLQVTAEEFIESFDSASIWKYDEIWIYNCLLHVLDVEGILNNLWKLAPVLRISEPCGTQIDVSHPTTFTKDYLRNKLQSISISFEEKEWMFDYLYYGGVCHLKGY